MKFKRMPSNDFLEFIRDIKQLKDFENESTSPVTYRLVLGLQIIGIKEVLV